MYAVISCDECFGSGLNPADTEDLCPMCRGYEWVPYQVRGLLERMAFADYPDIFRTRRQAVASIDPWYQ